MSHVHTLELRPPKPVMIPFLLSEGAHTRLEEIELDDDEELHIGDIFEHDEASWEINRIETKTGNSRRKLIASRIGRANAVRSDVVMVRLTLTRGEFSDSDAIFVEREKIFKAGSIFEHAGSKWKIRAIHTGAGRTMTGRVPAHDIKRIYLHEPRDQKRIFLELQEKEDRHGKKDDLVTIQIQLFLTLRSLGNPSNKDLVEDRKRRETDHGRFVQGIRNAFAT